MTASKYVKDKGFKSLAEVSRLCNKNTNTLYNWYSDNFQLFEAVVEGCKSKQSKQT